MDIYYLSITVKTINDDLWKIVINVNITKSDNGFAWIAAQPLLDDMELPYTKGHTSVPWNKCPKRGLRTTGGQIPIEKHYRSLH